MNCSVVNCHLEARRRGMCESHAYRAGRYGDPLGGQPRGSVKREFLALIAAETDGCVLWSHKIGPTGYAHVRHDGRTLGAHAVAAMLRLGERPSPSHVVAHSCRNRNCINYRHLRWATTSENHTDKWRDGTMPHGETHPRSKLTDDAVRSIRTLAPTTDKRTLAEMFGVSPITVRDVIKNRTWRHVA